MNGGGIVECQDKKYHSRKFNIAKFLAGIKKDVNFFFGILNRPGNIKISKRKSETIGMNRRIQIIVQELITGDITVDHFLDKLRVCRSNPMWGESPNDPKIYLV